MNVLDNFSDSAYYQKFEEYLKNRFPELYDSFTEEDKLDKFESVFMMGLNRANEFLDNRNSCDLLINDKPPRADMIQKLGNILWELESIPSYPVVPPLKIKAAIKKVLSSRDGRTREKYLTWMMQYSHHNREFNSVDLTPLVSKFPKEKIVQGGIW